MTIPVKPAVESFDRWLRTDFRALNTQLEEAYYAARREILGDRPELEQLRKSLLLDGGALTKGIDDDGTLPPDPQQRYELLGMVGYYLGACRRHEIDRSEDASADVLTSAWSIANRLGSSLGVAPRYVFAHQALYNLSVRDSYRTFTSLPDERAFIDNNGLAVLAYQRAANALRRIPPMGVSNPMAGYLLDDARAALDDVLGFNRTLSKTVEVDRFFFNIRPYFKPYRVGGVEYRGANAGDFAAVNEIDLALGLCQARDPFYQTLLAEKYAYVPPEEQTLLRAAVDSDSLLETFLRESATNGVTPHLRRNAQLFLAVCRAHGAAYAFHHQKLVKPFLERPAQTAPRERLDGITASGPPLETVIGTLERLRDLRSAHDRPGRPSARESLERLHEITA